MILRLEVGSFVFHLEAGRADPPHDDGPPVTVVGAQTEHAGQPEPAETRCGFVTD